MIYKLKDYVTAWCFINLGKIYAAVKIKMNVSANLMIHIYDTHTIKHTFRFLTYL